MTENARAAVLAFSQKLDQLRKQLGEVQRTVGHLHAEASGLGLEGPALDVPALLSDVGIEASDAEGFVRQAMFALTGLLNADALAAEALNLGWQWGGWREEGWCAWRPLGESGPVQELHDRTAAGLLHKVRHANAEHLGAEVGHE